MVAKIVSCGKTELASTISIVTQINQPTQEIEKFSGNAAVFFPSYSFRRAKLVKTFNHSLHYAAQWCNGCDIFRDWKPKPANQEKWQQQQIRIAALLTSHHSTQWKYEFLFSEQSKRSLSPKQQEVLAGIEAKVGGQN
jgi:hypothetical protein